MAIFRAPFRAWTAEQIAAYYRERTTVRYFPVLNAAEVTRPKIDGVVARRFELNGETWQLPRRFDWGHNPSADLEWLIMLHKFYYAVGLGLAYHETHDPRYVATWIALTDAWIDSVALDFLPGDVTGRRVQNWIFAHYYFVTAAPDLRLPPAFYLRFLRSIAQQVAYLCAHLSPERNHRTIELYAIFVAAVVFPELADAAAWLELAVRELWRNMQTDLLADGVQCELSTDYHHIVLRNYLGARRLAALNAIAFPEGTDALLRKALDFAMYAHRPDGVIPAFSDGDNGDFRELLRDGAALYGDTKLLYVASGGAQGTPPAQRAKGFAASGYYVVRSGWGDTPRAAFADEHFLMFDCGPLGAGNHGHLDLLSFELAAYGRPLVVDPGRYTYAEHGDHNWRVAFRGTAAHNTVVVDSQQQTRYEPGRSRYKIKGPAPEHELRTFHSCAEFSYLHGIARSHMYPVVHERHIFFVWPEYWIVSDRLRAAEPHDYQLRFHLAAEAAGNVALAEVSGTTVIDAPHLVLAQPHDGATAVALEDGWVAPTYGVKHPAPVVRFARRAADTWLHTVLYPYQAARPALSVRELPVFSGGRRLPAAQASAISITVATTHGPLTDVYLIGQPAAQLYTVDDLQGQGGLLFWRKDQHGTVAKHYAV